MTDTEELHAKCVIAAALLQSRTIQIDQIKADPQKSWRDDRELVRLRTLVDRIYGAITGPAS